MMKNENLHKDNSVYGVASNPLLTAVYDCVAKKYLGITVENSIAEAKRNFKVAVNTPNTLIHASKDDFELRCLGMINLTTGAICPIEPIDVLMRGVDIEI